jgi:hypothetical protein
MTRKTGWIRWAFTIILLLLASFPSNALHHRLDPKCVAAQTAVEFDDASRSFYYPNFALSKLRGGSVDESDDESSDSSDDDGLDTPQESVVLQIGKKTLIIAGKLMLATLKATSRAVVAAFKSDEENVDEDNVDVEEPSFHTKVFKVLTRMYRAAISPPESTVNDGSSKSKTLKKEKKLPSSRAKEEPPLDDALPTRLPDFGTYLTKTYQVEATRELLDDNADHLPALGGTINDALKIARSMARLLVVVIPASPAGKGNTQPDEEVIQSVLSAEVAIVAEKKARKQGSTGSFVIWGAKSGSAEAVAAMKRLKATSTNNKGQKRPILLVAYPAQVVNSRGQVTIVPRLLAQHHCSPPPSPLMMAAWLNALRKRHAKQYATMQLDLKEQLLHVERVEGYKESIQSDTERQARERREELKRIAKQQAEEERLEAIQQRRGDLRATMPDEPPKDAPDARTVALRLADGRSSQRRFNAQTPLSAIFNWVDVTFEIERETVVLTTMNGASSYEWKDSDSTLEDTSFGRMTGLRVTVQKDSPS